MGLRHDPVVACGRVQECFQAAERLHATARGPGLSPQVSYCRTACTFPPHCGIGFCRGPRVDHPTDSKGPLYTVHFEGCILSEHFKASFVILTFLKIRLSALRAGSQDPFQLPLQVPEENCKII